MKKNQFFLMIIFLFSCAKEALPQEPPKFFASCEEMTDITGLNLYPFEEPVIGIGIPELSKRQIPEDFLREMTTKELIYQISRIEGYNAFISQPLQDRIDLLPSVQARAFNMIAEMLERPDAGSVLMQILQKIVNIDDECECS